MDTEHHHNHTHHHEGPAADIPLENQATCPITGDLVDTREAEKLGHVREYNGKKVYLCCATCVHLFDKDPAKYIHHDHHASLLTLKEKEHLVDNVWAFRFESSRPLAWIPGQFIRVELDHADPDEEGTKRWFTISSAPYEGIIQITTRVTDSTFKQALDVLPIGGLINMIESPDGDFVWEESDRPLVFVAGGIGITPFHSMLKQRVHDRASIKATLIYGSRTDAVPFRSELDDWAKNSEFNLHYAAGVRLAPDKLIEYVPSLKESLVYISGPEPMAEVLSKQLVDAGLPEDQLRKDFFPNYNETNY